MIPLCLFVDFNSFIHLGTLIILVGVWYLLLCQNLITYGKSVRRQRTIFELGWGPLGTIKMFHLVQLQKIPNRDLSAIHKTLRDDRSAEAYFVFCLILSDHHCIIAQICK